MCGRRFLEPSPPRWAFPEIRKTAVAGAGAGGRRAAHAILLALAIITNVDAVRLAVNRVLVFHKGLEFQPNFTGCLLDST